MATKKAVTSVKKSTAKKPTSAAKSTAKTTTVKAVVSTKKVSLPSLTFNVNPIVKVLIAELVGTFLFASAVIAGQGQPIIILFALAGIMFLFASISGGHFNPAITFAAWLTKRITGLRALAYIVAQFVGAGLAFALLNAYVNAAAPASPALGQAAATLFHANAIPAGKEWFIFFSELIGTAVLGYTIATALRFKKDRVAAALTVGLGIFVALLLAASAAAYVGGSAIINPAIALSLQVVDWKSWWTLWPLAVYVLAPVLGAVIGFILHDITKTDDNE
jgi:aquaporin Z